jgi:hypothetical protein
VAGSGEVGEIAPSVAVPAGELGRTVAREALPLGTTQAPESADVHTGPTGEAGEESDGASGRPVTAADVVAGLVVARGDADPDPVGADSAAVTDSRGRYSSIPMSGNAQDSPYGNYAVWSFHTGTVASCAIFVYIPNNGNIQYVGGNPTNYTVHSDSNVSSGNEIGHFPIKQVDNLGQWYSAGTFPVSNGQIAVEIHDAGKDWNGNVDHASAEVKATCTG